MKDRKLTGTAKQLIASGDYIKAEEILKEALKENPKNPEAHFELGKIYFLRSDYINSIGELDLAARQDDADSQALRRQLKVFKHAGMLRDEIENCLKLVENKAADDEMRTVMAITYFKTGELYTILAGVYCVEGKNETAVEFYNKAVDTDNHTGAHAALGKYYLKEKKYEFSIEHFQKAIKGGLKTEEIIHDIGIARLLSGSFEPEADKEITGQRKRDNTAFDRTPGRPAVNFEKIAENTELALETDKKRQRAITAFLKEFSGDSYKPLKTKIIRLPFFINTPGDEDDFIRLMPLGMAQIVSYLRCGGIDIDQDDLNIKIHHDNIFGDDSEKIDFQVFFNEEKCVNYTKGEEVPEINAVLERVIKKTDLKGYSLLLLSVPSEPETGAGINFLITFAKYIKSRYPLKIAAGGFDPSEYVGIQFHSPAIDYIIMNEGEIPLFYLLSALNYSVDISSEVPNITVEDRINIIYRKEQIWPVEPDYAGLPVELYGYRKNRRLPEGDAETGEVLGRFNDCGIKISPFRLVKGCPHGCIFCQSSLNSLSKMLGIKKSVGWLKRVSVEHGIRGFFFINETFNISREYVNRFCDALMEEGLNILWSDCARAEDLDLATLKKMRKAGCIRLIYGMESASPGMLDYIGKKIILEELEEILRLTDEAGIWTGLEIICGFPHETLEDIHKTVGFIKKNKKYINHVYYNAFSLRENSRMFADPGRYGIENIGDAAGEKNICRDDLHINLLKYRFDEIGGLKWKDKLQQIIASYHYVIKATKPAEGFPMNNMYYELEHLLYFLYSEYAEKKEVLRLFNKINNYIFDQNHKKR